MERVRVIVESLSMWMEVYVGGGDLCPQNRARI